jgi:prolyl-tRNA synthetase
MEAIMPDGKALQMGTSHNLGQNFAKSFNVMFKDKNENDQYVWQTSWGFSTRLIGALGRGGAAGRSADCNPARRI